MKDEQKFIENILEVKRAKLIEKNLSFEDLKFCNNFTDEEITTQFNKKNQEDIQLLKAIKRAKNFK